MRFVRAGGGVIEKFACFDGVVWFGRSDGGNSPMHVYLPIRHCRGALLKIKWPRERCGFTDIIGTLGIT